MLAGSTEEEMKEFRKKQRKEASQHFDKRVADLKEKMKEIIEKEMASGHSAATLQSAAETATILESLEDAYPQPTLRLRLQNQTGEKSSEEIEREATEALEKLLKELEQALDGNSETPRAFLKSLVPEKGDKTDEEHQQALDNFSRRAMPVLRELMQEQSSITAELLERVKCYLVKSWKMMLAGSTEEEMKEFRKKQRKEASQHFDKRVADLKEKMKEQAIEFSSDGQQINGQQINGGGYGGGRG